MNERIYEKNNNKTNKKAAILQKMVLKGKLLEKKRCYICKDIIYFEEYFNYTNLDYESAIKAWQNSNSVLICQECFSIKEKNNLKELPNKWCKCVWIDKNDKCVYIKKVDITMYHIVITYINQQPLFHPLEKEDLIPYWILYGKFDISDDIGNYRLIISAEPEIHKVKYVLSFMVKEINKRSESYKRPATIADALEVIKIVPTTIMDGTIREDEGCQEFLISYAVPLHSYKKASLNNEKQFLKVYKKVIEPYL